MGKKVDPKMTIGEYLAEYPSAREVFDKYKLDYCCGSTKELQIAVKEREVSFEELEKELRANINEYLSMDEILKEWYGKSLTELVDYLIDHHHNFLREQFEKLDKLFREALNKEKIRDDDIVDTVQAIYKEEIRDQVLDHLDDEEQIIFPFIKELDSYSSKKTGKKPMLEKEILVAYIDHLVREHYEVVEAQSRIKEVTDNYSELETHCSEMCQILKEMQLTEKELHEHTMLENNILYPETIKLDKTLS